MPGKRDERMMVSPMTERAIRRFPIPDPHEELVLALKAKEGDAEAIEALVGANQRKVLHLARYFVKFRSKASLMDFVNEGNVGLMHAIPKYDPERGARFTRYAERWAYSYMMSLLMEQVSIVKVCGSQTTRHLFYRLSRTEQKIRTERPGIGDDELEERLADELDVSVDVILKYRMSRQPVVSLNAPVDDSPDSDMLQDIIVDERQAEHRADMLLCVRERYEAVMEALPCLDDRERLVITERFLSDAPPTLRQLGEQIGICRERVRQLEMRAMRKIRAHVEGNGASELVVGALSSTHHQKRRSVKPSNAPQVMLTRLAADPPQWLLECLQELPEFEQQLFVSLYMTDPPCTVREIAKLFGMSQGRLLRIATRMRRTISKANPAAQRR